MKTLKKLFLFLLLSANIVSAQVSINTDGTTSAPSAILDVKSTTKGLLIPRMTLNQRNLIVAPADGLMIFCTNCSQDGTGTLSIYSNGGWFTLNPCPTPSPTPDVNIPLVSSIVWNWNAVAGAIGYKWGTTNYYGAAIDMGINLSTTESGLNCGTSYTRYIWSINICGISSPLIVTETTSVCLACGVPITKIHQTGNVAPVNKTTIYGTVTNLPGENGKCWITSNLGSDHQAAIHNDLTEASAGWYWQFNKRQGFKHDGTSRTPNSWITSFSENSNWTSANDPCSLELGNGWRIPTRVEWTNVDASGGWGNWLHTFSSPLKLHAAGRLNAADGSLVYRGAYGIYWSSTQTTEVLAWRLNFTSGSCTMGSFEKPNAYTVRCISD